MGVLLEVSTQTMKKETSSAAKGVSLVGKGDGPMCVVSLCCAGPRPLRSRQWPCQRRTSRHWNRTWRHTQCSPWYVWAVTSQLSWHEAGFGCIACVVIANNGTCFSTHGCLSIHIVAVHKPSATSRHLPFCTHEGLDTVMVVTQLCLWLQAYGSSPCWCMSVVLSHPKSCCLTLMFVPDQTSNVST